MMLLSCSGIRPLASPVHKTCIIRGSALIYWLPDKGMPVIWSFGTPLVHRILTATPRTSIVPLKKRTNGDFARFCKSCAHRKEAECDVRCDAQECVRENISGEDQSISEAIAIPTGQQWKAKASPVPISRIIFPLPCDNWSRRQREGQPFYGEAYKDSEAITALVQDHVACCWSSMSSHAFLSRFMTVADACRRGHQHLREYRQP